MVLATFAAVAVPMLLYQAVVHIAWGLTVRMDDWRAHPWEFRNQRLKSLSIVATHPGEMLMLALAVWTVQKLHSGGGGRRRVWERRQRRRPRCEMTDV